MAYKHIPKAENIVEEAIYDPEKRKYGTTYDFVGGTASNFQFVITDSTSKVWRGAMYFNCPPNPDSLRPAEIYIKKDLEHLLKTFEWTE
jgi:gliding motility-associated lipoprotein GldD